MASKEMEEGFIASGTARELGSQGAWDTRKEVVTWRVRHREQGHIYQIEVQSQVPDQVQPLSELRLKVRGPWWEEWLTGS